MKSLLLFFALAIPTAGFSATLSLSAVDSAASVNLASVGTLDWARWPGHVTKSNLISDVTTTGVFKVYTNDKRSVSGTTIAGNTGVKVSGRTSSMEFTAQATTAERTLLYYVSGWNSTGKITVTLPGATTYSTTFTSTSYYNRVVTIRYRGDATGVLRVRYELTAGAGSINMQAVALQASGTTTPPPTTNGAATLTWVAPTKNSDGTALNDLTGFKIYWGKTQGQYTNSFRISNLLMRSYTVSGLTSGRWYFAVTAINVKEQESSLSNVANKVIP